MQSYGKTPSQLLQKPQPASPYMFTARRADMLTSRIRRPNEASSRKLTKECGTRRVLTANVDENRRQANSSDVAANTFNNLKCASNLAGIYSLPENWGNLQKQRQDGFGFSGGRRRTQKTEAERKTSGPLEATTRRREAQFRMLTGPVEKVAHWFPLKNRLNLLVEVIALLAEKRRGALPTEWRFVLRDDTAGPSLLVTYYEMDRSLSDLAVGGVVRCVGRMTSRGSMQAFKVEESSEQERTDSHRLFFISGLVADEAKEVFSKKK